MHLVGTNEDVRMDLMVKVNIRLKEDLLQTKGVMCMPYIVLLLQYKGITTHVKESNDFISQLLSEIKYEK